MEAKNYIQVLIDGKIYTIGGSEDEAYLQKAANYVNEKNAVMHRIPGFSRQSADYQQIMLELNIADDYFKALEKAESMEKLKNEMEKETYSLKHKLVTVQIKQDDMLKKLEDRQRQLEELAASNARLERELKAAKKQAERSRMEAESAREEIAAGYEISEDLEISEISEETENSQISETPENLQESETASGEDNIGNGSAHAEGLSEEELAKRALQAARKAGTYRNGRR